MSTELALLRRVASRSETEADRQALADRLHTYLTTSEPLSLDAVFGLASLPGRPSWRRVDALDRRDAAFRAIARRYYHGLPVATQARDIRAAMVAYASTSWRFDSRSIMPPNPGRLKDGTRTVEIWSSVPSKDARRIALLDARDRLEAMKSEPDQSSIVARIAAIVEALPDGDAMVQVGDTPIASGANRIKAA